MQGPYFRNRRIWLSQKPAICLLCHEEQLSYSNPANLKQFSYIQVMGEKSTIQPIARGTATGITYLANRLRFFDIYGTLRSKLGLPAAILGFHGVGPHHFNKNYTWQYKGLLVGFDPVAVDSVGVRILQAKRKEYFKEERPINPPVKHIFLADTRHNLGTADPEKIELIKLGWDEDLLI